MKVGNMWRCGLVGCTWFIQKGLEDMLMNRPAICWGCDQTFAFDMGNLAQDKPTCYSCSPVATIEQIDSVSGTIAPIKLDVPVAVTPVLTLEQIVAQYEVFKSVAGVYAADKWKETKLALLKEQQERAQATVEEDKPESEYIPPKYDVDS